MSCIRNFLVLLCVWMLFNPSQVADAAPPAQRFDGLGSLSRPVSTGSADAQAWFNQGLAFMYAFNHDEAIRSFRQAAVFDPQCAMCFWGIAIANGPHINNTVVPPERSAAAIAALGKARSVLGNASAVERELIEAQQSRYAEPPPVDRKPLEQAYADAMHKVWQNHPQDADVGALYAESLADLRPWDLWTHAGKPQPGTLDLIKVLDAVLVVAPGHPLANHLYIHALEMSPEPERADRAADTLRNLQPGLGHMVHMPSHIDVRRGRWVEAIIANRKAIDADTRYTELSQQQEFYRLYMAHNYHMLTYAAMMNGESELAMKTIREMVARIPADFFRDNAFIDGMMVMPLEVLMRFGKWDAILAEPAYPDYVPLSGALQHYARAVAHSARGDNAAAVVEQAAFMTARARVPAEQTFGNNTAIALLDIAEHVMNGELLIHTGQMDAGIASLRKAVEYEDGLRYDEPRDWIQPTRHPLGAALLQAGKYADAEAVFRADLKHIPGNGWGLYGLSRALQLQNKTAEAEATMERFDAVWKNADIQIKSACLCLPGV